MPRLLMVTTVPLTFDFLAPFALHFRKLGWTVDALSGSIEGLDERGWFDDVYAVEWSRNPFDLRNFMSAPRRVREVVARGGYDIVHVHTSVAAFITRLALRRREGGRPRVIYTAHGFHFHPRGSVLKNVMVLALEKLAARWTDYLTVMNREDAEAAARYRLLPETRVRLMPGIGVDLHCYSPEQVDPVAVRQLRQSLRLADEPCFLMVAEFIERKRHRDLLEAFAALAADPSAPRAHLVLAGNGPALEPLRSAARKLGVARQIHFLGHRRDVPVLMRASIALVLPSDQEGLPRSILEAMSMGLPVIGTRIRGTTELLEGGCGFLYEVGDTRALASLLRSALLEQTAFAAAARRARERVARYDENNLIRHHEELYAKALSSSPSQIAEQPRRLGGVI